jgi:hypothetical protein
MIQNRFDRAIQALISAFFDGTLIKADCRACAVGNMVASSIGQKLDPKKLIDIDYKCELRHWAHVFVSKPTYQVLKPECYGGKAKMLIDSTNYTWQELAKVEKAFEDNTKINGSMYRRHSKDEIMQDQYNGLMAVVSVLCGIEGIENQEEYKEMFAYQKV